MSLLFCVGLLSFNSSFAHAAACSIVSDPGSGAPVIFFGGWKAQESDGQRWAAGAARTANSKCPRAFKFEGHGLNGAGSNDGSVTNNALNKAAVQSCVQQIKAYSGPNKIVLVGHSDGSWMVRNIINGLTNPSDRAKVSAKILDGNPMSFGVWGSAGAPYEVSCYTTSNGAVPNCASIRWPPHKSDDPPYTDNMRNGACEGNCHAVAIPDLNCVTDKWRNHFSLVSNATSCGFDLDNINSKAYTDNMSVPLGFLGCDGATAPPLRPPPAGGTGTTRAVPGR